MLALGLPHRKHCSPGWDKTHAKTSYQNTLLLHRTFSATQYWHLSHSFFTANKKELLLLPYLKSSSHQEKNICPWYRQKRGCSLTKASRKTWQTLDSLVTTHSLELFNGLAILQAHDQVINSSWHNIARSQPAKQQGSDKEVRSQHTEKDEFTSLTGKLPHPKPQPTQTSGTSKLAETSCAQDYED